MPLRTASDQAFWTALASGDFVAASAASTALELKPGASYRLDGASAQIVKFGLAAKLGPGRRRPAGQPGDVGPARPGPPGGGPDQRAGREHGDADQQGRRRSSAPSGRIELLRGQLPAAGAGTGTAVTGTGTATAGSAPSSYLQLFKASAAQYCPGLSWTVLAAIGQIESADGTNVGPSSAGALGPMQFLPSTWAAWGIDAFGQTGPPDVLNPYDAVPSAAQAAVRGRRRGRRAVAVPRDLRLQPRGLVRQRGPGPGGRSTRPTTASAAGTDRRP